MKISTYLNKVKMIEKSMEITKQTIHSPDDRIAFNMYDSGALKILKMLAIDDHEISVDDYLTLTIEISKVENHK